MKTVKNETYETYLFRNIKQRSGELFEDFTHRCEVGITGFVAEDRDRHVRDQIVFGTCVDSVREKGLSNNLSLADLIKTGNALECSWKFGAAVKFKPEPQPYNHSVNAIQDRSSHRGQEQSRDQPK